MVMPLFILDQSRQPGLRQVGEACEDIGEP